VHAGAPVEGLLAPQGWEDLLAVGGELAAAVLGVTDGALGLVDGLPAGDGVTVLRLIDTAIAAPGQVFAEGAPLAVQNMNDCMSFRSWLSGFGGPPASELPAFME